MFFFERFRIIHHFSRRKIQFVFEMVTRVESHDNLQFHYVPNCHSIERTPKNQNIQNLELFYKLHGKCQKGKSSIRYCTNLCIDVFIQSKTYQYDEESMLYHFFSSTTLWIHLFVWHKNTSSVSLLMRFKVDTKLDFLFLRCSRSDIPMKKILLNISIYFVLKCVLEYFRKIPIDVEFGKKQRVRTRQKSGSWHFISVVGNSVFGSFTRFPTRVFEKWNFFEIARISRGKIRFPTRVFEKLKSELR